ncbi:MAG: TonB-dependent receptor [Pyrinomonadaceae bacterium MAG19_C2-C3]|nr:TonB-dependent receptor [Pyrinomonadaceae bacterium MAG19_C2-C3]
MRKSTILLKATLFAMLATGIVPSVCAQTINGAVSGTVTDAAGAAVPKATITARNPATGTTTEAISSDDGNYRLQQLPAGSYNITVTAPGFKTGEFQEVVVEVNSTTSRDLVLETGAVTETVTVSSEGALTIQSDTSDIGTVVRSRQVLDLPLVAGGGGFGLRSPESFTFLTPGVVGPGTATDNGVNNDNAGENGGTFNSKFAGSQNFSNEVLLEGASTFRSENGSSFDETAPSVEAFQEFKVLTSNLSAEYGRTGGGITSFAYKSGTNDINGSAYEFFQNRVLNANRFFNNSRGTDPVTGKERAPRPLNNINDFGATVGGPIFLPRFGEGGPRLYDGRNKSFFFFIYEGARRGFGGSAINTLPTDAFRRGDFSSLLGANSAVDALGRNIANGQIFDPATTRRVTAGQPDPLTGIIATRSGLVREPFANNNIPVTRFSTVASNVLNFIPSPNSPGRTNNFIFNGPKFPLNVYTYAVKLDHNITAGSKLSGSYSKRVNDRVVGARSLPDVINRGNQDQIFTTQYFRLTHDQVFSPTILNHFNIGLNRTVSENLSPTVGLNIPGQIGLSGVAGSPFPEFNFGEDINGIGFGLNAVNIDNGFRLNDFVSIVKGNHNIRVGGDFRYQQYTPSNQNNTSGTFNFGRGQTAGFNSADGTAGNTGNGFASFLLGQVGNANIAIVPNIVQWRSQYYAGFVQDDWKVSGNLTLNLGVRYDVDVPRRELYNRFSNFSPTTPNPGAGNLPGAVVFANSSGNTRFADTYKKAIGPRVGFAYSPDRNGGLIGALTGGAGKTVIRGGFGIFYQALLYADFGESYARGFNSRPDFSPAVGFNPAFQLDQGLPQNFPRPPFVDPTIQNLQNTEYIAPSFGRPPMITNYGGELQRELSPDLILTLGYIGVQGHHLRSNLLRTNNAPNTSLALGDLIYADINSPQAQAAGFRPPFAGFTGNVGDSLRPFPQYRSIITDNGLENVGNSNYNAGFVKLERRFRQGLNLLTSYTFSKTLTDADSALPIFATFSGGGEVQNPFNLRDEKALSNQDIPHRLVVSYIYELPLGEDRRFATGNRVVDKIIGGFQVGAVHQYQSGNPLSFGGTQGIPTYGRIRYSRVPGQPLESEAVRNGTFDPNAPGAQGEYFNRAAFYDPNALCPVRNGAVVTNDPLFFNCRQSPSAPLRFGDFPRTTGEIRVGQFYNEDINILKKTQINEDITLEFRTEFFNVFNRTILRRPNSFGGSQDSNSIFGRVFGQSNNPRVIQFGLKLLF